MSDQQTSEPHSVTDVVEGLEELAESEDKVTFGDVLDKFGSRSFAPLMMVLAMLEVSPLGAIPGVPTLLAICILLIAAQMLIGRDHIWVPDWIENRSVSGDHLQTATGKLDGTAEKLDNLSGQRLEFLTKGPAIQAAALVIMILCLLVAPLEVLPWASMGPMLAIAIISLAIMARDGLAMLIAWLIALGAVGGAIYYFVTSGVTLSDFNPF
ncbi:MAG: exopolysaccharide biosynthesis protein [Erythrobacter sp.]